MLSYNMNIQTIRKNVKHELDSIKDKITKKTYTTLERNFNKLIQATEKENGKKTYPKNKKTLLSFSAS